MVKRAKIPKDVAIMAAGAATGCIVPVVLTQYVDIDQPPLFPEWGAWGKYGTLVPIAGGAISLGLAMFTNVIKKANFRKFLGMFGVTMLTTGVLTGAFAAPAARYGARAQVARAVRPAVRRATAGYLGVPAGGLTPTGITQQTVYA